MDSFGALYSEQVRDLVDREYLLHAEGRNQQFMDDILSKTRLNNIERHYQQRVQERLFSINQRAAFTLPENQDRAAPEKLCTDGGHQGWDTKINHDDTVQPADGHTGQQRYQEGQPDIERPRFLCQADI